MAGVGAGRCGISGCYLSLIFGVSEYQPISCIQHERLEFSVLRKIPLQLEYLLDSGKIHQNVMPLDVATRHGAEWLKFRVIGTEDVTEIRLDSIISFVEQSSS